MIDLLEQSLEKLLSASCQPEVVADAERAWPEQLWSKLDASGAPMLGVAESQGGASGGWAEMVTVARVAARWAAPVPLAETIVARWLADRAALPLPDGPITLATGDELTIDNSGRLTGRVQRVPWARAAHAVLLRVHGKRELLVVADPASATIADGMNLAREPRDRLTFDHAAVSVAPAHDLPAPLDVAAALMRTAQIVGALERILALSVEYARVREQFGRPIFKFQAVQDLLARLAGETAAARAAVAAAVGRDGEIASVAAAKIRASAAASEGARVAHQIHGAIGVTYEHELHNFTSRVLSWRDEFGSDRDWARRLGTIVTRHGASGYWAWLTQTPTA